MAEIAICSLVRDGMEFLPTYRSQIENLRLLPDDTWRLYIVEGDSRDGSRAFLQRWAEEDKRVTIGHEDVGNADGKEDRAVRLARAGNTCFELIPSTSAHTHVLWIESDLCFPAETLSRLLRRNVDIVAPIIYLGGMFYDTWGFRDLRGRNWLNSPPYHPDFRPRSLMEMGSVGSCVLFRRAVLDAGIKFKGAYEHGLLVGMCDDARCKGFRVWVDTTTAILHPMDCLESQTWKPLRISVLELSAEARTIQITDPCALGLEPNLPLLDAEKFLWAHRAFVKRMFRDWHTNRLDIQVIAHPHEKTYELLVHLQQRKKLARLGKLWNLVLRAVLLSLMKTARDADPKIAESQWLHGAFSCRMTITIASDVTLA